MVTEEYIIDLWQSILDRVILKCGELEGMRIYGKLNKYTIILGRSWQTRSWDKFNLVPIFINKVLL